MVQGCNRPRLALKPAGVFGLDALDRDDAVEPRIMCFPYLAHTSQSDRAEDFILIYVSLLDQAYAVIIGSHLAQR
jgi:hypothetical protein